MSRVPRLVVLVCALAAAGALLAACGGGGGTPARWAAAGTRTCLREAGLRLTPVSAQDLVASTATAGALHVKLPYNGATILFGEDTAEAARLQSAYVRFGPKSYQAPSEVNRNVLILWAVNPSDREAQAVRQCLR